MVQIIPNNQKASFGEIIGRGLVEGLSQFSNAKMQEEANRAQEAQKMRLMEKEYGLKGQLEAVKGAKPLNDLQQAQKNLAEEKLRSLQQQQELFKSLYADHDYENVPQEQSGFDISSVPESKLRQIAAFAGQPGEAGLAGNIAKAQLEKMEKERQESPQFQRQKILTQQQAKADTKFYSDLNERRSKQILKKDSLDRLEQMNKKKQTGKVFEKFLDSLGLTAKTSEGRREFAAEVKNQFTDFKQIAGSQLSAQEFFILSGAYPSADFSPEANKAIIDNLKLVHDTLDEEYKVAQRLKKENKGNIPENFQEKVNTEVQDYVSKRIGKIKDNVMKVMNDQYGIPKGHSLMFDLNGDPLSVPDSDVARLLDEGLANLP